MNSAQVTHQSEGAGGSLTGSAAVTIASEVVSAFTKCQEESAKALLEAARKAHRGPGDAGRVQAIG